jgi:hypothetical protein
VKPTVHLVASAIVSGSIYAGTRSVTIAAVSFLWGFLIDLDHVVEYVREYGWRLDVREFFRVFYETRFRKLVLLFHAWEWVAALALYSLLAGWNGIITGLLIGTLHHLILDQLGNGSTRWGYFITWRAMRRFTMTEMIRESRVRERRGQKQDG